MDYHDMLAKLGVGSAHPGGMKSTLSWLRRLELTDETKVLDVGCGTGRTSCLLQKMTGCHVTGVDIRPRMVQKATMRAEKEGANIRFVVASAEHLPFKDNEFDIVVTESVNVFLHLEKALKQYFRVLKPGGYFVDVEMATFGPVTKEWLNSVRDVYGARLVPDIHGWKTFYRSTGFTNIETLFSTPVKPGDSFELEAEYPDLSQLADADAMQDHRVISIMQKNSMWLEKYHQNLLFGVFVSQKPSASEQIEDNHN
jgi:ubiquinone/menaquinone biosynthesis C-methylase UbiE